MLYRILLFSAKPQREPAVGVHVSPRSGPSLPIPPLWVGSEPLFEPWLSLTAVSAVRPLK